MVHTHVLFWREHPALLLGLSLLIGASSVPFSLLWFLYLLWIRAYPSLLLTVAGILYAFCLNTMPPSNQKGTAYFSIASLKASQSPFQKGYIYRGSLYMDEQKIPCSVHFSDDQRPMANCDYLLEGQLQQRTPFAYTFKAKKWTPVEQTRSLSEWRYQTKEAVRRFLEKKLPSPRVASFLSSLITGDIEDRTLRYEFGKLGLQHLLAISGFHFGLLIAFCSFFLKLFLPPRFRWIVLIIAVNVYFLFVGSLPAIQRSWLIAQLYLISQLIRRRSSSLNLLGVALLIEVMLDPHIYANIGFQLSFVSCTGILLLFQLFEKIITQFLPRRSVTETMQLDSLSRH